MALRKKYEELQKGDWLFLNDDRFITVQFGDEAFSESTTIPVSLGGLIPSAWKWDGNKESPTLEPSILVFGKGGRENPLWHGFLRNGKLETA